MISTRDNEFSSKITKTAEIAAITVKGDRESQQDCFGYEADDEQLLFCLCDGMGGISGGALASKTAVTEVVQTFEALKAQKDICKCLTLISKAADEKIFNLKDNKGDHLGAGTTIVSLCIRQNQLYWNAIGDSRLYVLRKNGFVQMTYDQNYRKVLEEKAKKGQISQLEFEQETYKKKSDTLINYLGIGALELIDHNEEAFELKKEDALLICSDGLYRLVEDVRLAEIIKASPDIETALQWLEREARQEAGNRQRKRDNMTAALIRIR